jgi:rhodanese-related sulfurtransferase
MLCLLLSSGQSAIALEQLAQQESSDSVGLAISIDSEHLIELYQSESDLKIIDSRLRPDHVLGHIERSSNLPPQNTDCDDLSRLGGNTDQVLVFYCNRGGGSSAEAIRIACACGYRRLFWLDGGIVERKGKDYPFVVE